MLGDAVEWSALSAPEINALARADAIVILPVASVEQHGPHLPTGCDTILTTEIARRVARRVREHRPIVVAPPVWSGLADHHVSLGATFTLSLPTLHALLRDLVASLQGAGFSKVLLLNGHGGNAAALNILTGELARETGVRVASASYIALAQRTGEIGRILEDQPGIHHACEAETSMIMAVAPDLVREDRLPQAFQEGYRRGDGSPLAEPLLVWMPFESFTANGIRGDARRASPEKGERLLEAVVASLADALVAGEPWTRTGAAP